ncbi:DUF2934 domain-containing protein [Rhizobium sp. 1AS11]|uniref:DUF2934 domain-containing protein n=1 Tax=Rhizobium acaciae TaxID=2989736 RepID=UPI0022214A9A|nr:DUF2934 domain-containing protein [Rhizobium acaciae]MCW1411933.1 DUF2934 domain-containing protein [Rhizobium acaciae]MCW1744083.1 DUF2934 domain-containing protein [Rhizobium acaciae]
MASQDDVIRRHAYRIWEAEGRPDGRQSEHWRAAEEQLAAGSSERLAAPAVISKRGDSQGGLEFDENAIAHPEDRPDLKVAKAGAATFVSTAPTKPGRAEDERSEQN